MSVPETTRAIWEEMAMMTNMKARGKDRITHMPAKLMYGACKGKYVACKGKYGACKGKYGACKGKYGACKGKYVARGSIGKGEGGLEGVSHHITSNRIPSHPIISHHITSHHITSPDGDGVRCHIISHISHHITSHHIYHIISHHITSHHIYHITSHHIISYHITKHTAHHIVVITSPDGDGVGSVHVGVRPPQPQKREELNGLREKEMDGWSNSCEEVGGGR